MARHLGDEVATTVVRLPRQHRERPHCVECGRDLPTFQSTHIDLAFEDTHVELLAVTFHVRCICGVEARLTKRVKP